MLPAPDFTDNNLSDSIPNAWAENGDPDFVDDLHNPGAAFSGDGDDSLQQDEVVPDNASPILSYAFDLKTTTSSGGIMLGQWLDQVSINGDRGSWFAQMNNNGTLSQSFMTTNDGSGVFSSSTNSGPFYNDGVRHRIFTVGNGNDVDIYVDGAEVTYQSQDFIMGGGFTAINNNSQPLGVGNSIGGAVNNFHNGEIGRIDIWIQKALTAADALEDYNNWLASQGEGFGPPIGTLSLLGVGK